MRRSFLAAASSLLFSIATPAVAGPHDDEIEAIVAQVVADWSTVLSCSVLDFFTHQDAVALWEIERRRLADILPRAGVAPAVAAEMMARTEVAELMEPTTGDLPTLIAYCQEDRGWRTALYMPAVVQPAAEIEELLGRR